jgi:hypothetical protein
LNRKSHPRAVRCQTLRFGKSQYQSPTWVPASASSRLPDRTTPRFSDAAIDTLDTPGNAAAATAAVAPITTSLRVRVTPGLPIDVALGSSLVGDLSGESLGPPARKPNSVRLRAHGPTGCPACARLRIAGQTQNSLSGTQNWGAGSHSDRLPVH